METALKYAKCNYTVCGCNMIFLLNECNDCYDLYCTLNKNFLCRDCQTYDDKVKRRQYLLHHVFNKK